MSDENASRVDTSDEVLHVGDVHEWNLKIIEEFRANEGRVGGRFEGAPMILVHHVGARTGIERISPLVTYPQPDGRYLIIAANAGAPTHPGWYHNLKARPSTRVEVGDEIFGVQVDELVGGARDEMWVVLKAIAPVLVDYERKAVRTIPVLVLTRS